MENKNLARCLKPENGRLIPLYAVASERHNKTNSSELVNWATGVFVDLHECGNVKNL
jgi:hypothetical protein